MEGYKSCSRCGEDKPLSEFYISKIRSLRKGSTVYFSDCKSCHQKRMFRRSKLDEYQILVPIEGEEWRDVVGYEGFYKISSFGRVLSVKTRNKIRVAHKTYDGYMRVELSKDGVNTIYGVHILVGKAFIPNPENKPTVNHKWGIKDDNRVSELEWATRDEQMQHAYKLGLCQPKRGEDNTLSKLTNIQAIEVCNSPLSDTEVSKIYNVSRQTINKIRLGKTYGSATGRIYQKSK